MPAMRRRTPTEIGDYVAILRRRAWWILVPAILVTGGTAMVARRLPKVYRSESLILVEPQKVPADFVRPTVTSDVAERLNEISQQILSRTNLLAIVAQYGLYPEVKNSLTQEQLVARMRSDIQVTTSASGDDRGGSVGAFRIAYEGPDPTQAQQVTNKLDSLFIEENLKVRQSEAVGTKDFIDSELDKARQTLEAESNQLQAIKARNMGSLPEQQSANLQELSNLQTLMQGDSDSIARDQQTKTYLQGMLTNLASPQLAPQSSPLAAELAKDETQLTLLEQVDRPTHPDVIRMQDQIAALKKAIAGSAKPGSSAAEAAGSGPREQLRRQIEALDADIHLRTEEQAERAKRGKLLQARVEREPAVEAAMASVQRDYDIAKANYESLLQKKNAASMAAAMEAQAEGEEFRVIDPANLPERPSKPNLPQLYMMAVVFGIFAGVVAGGAREFADGSIHNQRDLAYYLAGVPLLAAMPALVTQASRRQARSRRRWLVAVGSAMICAAALGVGFYLHAHGRLGLTQWF